MSSHAKRAGVLAAFLILLGAPASATAQAAPQPATPDSARLVLARRLVVALRFSEKFSKEFASGFAAAQAKNFPRSLADSMMQQFVKGAPELVDSLVPIYAAAMPKADLEEVVRFFESPIGQQYVTAQTDIDKQSVEMATRWAMRIAMATMTRMMNSGKLTADSLK